MNLRKAWAVAADIWYMPAAFFSFFGQNLKDDYTSRGNEPLKPCPNPGSLASLFNDAALGAAAVSGLYAMGAGAPVSTQLLGGVAMVGALLTGVAVNFAVWGQGMVLRDKVLAKMLHRDRRIDRPVGRYMFPRLAELNSAPGPAPRN